MPATLVVKDLSPKFLKFYELAKDADPDRRWELWQEHYRFAAVPPTEEGMRAARQMLDASFHRYPEVMDSILAGPAGFRPDPQASLDAVCQLLGFDGDLEVSFVTYVGNLEPNAFAVTMNGRSLVHFPLDCPDEEFRRFTLPHEFAHIVHMRLCSSPGGYVKPVGFLAMMEGLAIWTSQQVSPGLPEARYIEFEPGWLDRCREQEQAILTGIRPWLTVASEEAMWRFTMGTGPAGLNREAYYAGWRVVGYLLEQGRTLAELARIPEDEVATLFDKTIAEMTA